MSKRILARSMSQLRRFTAMGARGYIRGCSLCHRQGHDIRTCPTRSEPYPPSECSNCGSPGHNMRTCPTRPR